MIKFTGDLIIDIEEMKEVAEAMLNLHDEFCGWIL